MSTKNFTYTLQIDAEIKNLLAKTEQVKKSMAGITANGKMPEMDKQLLSIERSLTKLQEKAATPITSAAAFGSMQKDVAATKVAIEGLSGSVTKLQTASTGEKLQFVDPNMLKTIQAADAALDAFGTATSEASKKTTDLVTAEKLLAAANRDVEKAQNGVNKSQEKADIAKGRVEAAKKEADAIKQKLEILKKWQATQQAYDAPDEKGNKPDKRSAISPEVNYRKDKNAAQGLGIDISTPEKLNEAIQTLNASLTTQESEVNRLNAAYNTADRTLKNNQDKLTDTTAASTKAQQAFDKLNAEFEQNKAKNSQAAFDTLRASVEKLGIDLSDIPTQYTEQNLEALRAKCDQLKNQGIQGVDTSLDGLETSLRETGEAAEATSNKIGESAGEFKKLDEQAGQTSAFVNRIKQFVGLQGAAMLARRALRDAFNSVKELDAAMTEMSVVTDTDISGYWDQLPQYTQRANEMGLAIKDVYKADTLFYQQGLKTEEVVALSTETMKMARIAGLDTAEATDRMTAALRGFNMELNEANAQKVADVYSQLAAITASDVDEISSAMTKTASIAANAGMEFETTAAFLSQIIETTRESAETAGTAMKTVIARFQELKKDPAEIGEVDGEIVDANKIETALRSVGVSLRDANGQFRELDEVFLELSSKWDSLDTNTQRYIATIAAGSRQQSRFIAMMSDYSRTTELVETANTSAGASNEQFEKTMDSLDAKLNELKNAWDSFTMSIMNSDLLKLGVDLLTQFLTAINNITDAFGDFSGAAKIGLIVAALYLGDKAIGVFRKSLQGGSTVFQAFGKTGRAAVDSIRTRFARLTNLIRKNNKEELKLKTDKATKAMNSYTVATNNQITAQKMRETVSNNAMISEEARATRMAALDEVEINNEHRKTAAIAEYAAATGLTNSQATVAMGLQAMGISQDTAEMAALGGLTAAKMAEYQASMIAAGMDQTEIAIRMGQIAGLYAEAGAETAATAAKKTGIAALWAKVVAVGAHIAALIGQTVAQWAANIATYAGCPPTIALAAAVLLLVAAIVAVVAIIALFVAALVSIAKNSPEAQLKSAQEAAKATEEAANDAAEACDNLASSFDSLAERYQAMEELVKGTEAWREAVKGVNEEVLELIEKYPELAPLVERDSSDGLLKLELDSAEAQAVLKKYEEEAAITANANLAAKINVTEKQTNLTGSDIQNDMAGVAISNGETTTYVDLSLDTMKSLSQAMTSGEIIDDDGDGSMADEYEAWLSEHGTAFEATHANTFAAQLDQNVDSLRNFGEELDTAAAQQAVYMQEMANNAVSMIDETQHSAEEMSQIQTAASSEMAQRMNDAAQKKFENSTKEEQQQAKEDVAKSLYGEDATVSGNTITYYDEDGNKQTKELTDEEFKEQWAAMEATTAMTKALELVPTRINKVAHGLEKFDKGLGSAYKSLMTDASKTTLEQANKLVENSFNADGTVSDELYKTLQNSFASMTQEEKDMYGGDLDTYIEEMTGPLKEINTIFATSVDKIKGYSSAITEINSSFTTDALQGYERVLGQLSSSLGNNKEALGDINDSINALASEMSDEEFNTFMTQFNSLDFTNLDSLEGFDDTLKELGMANIATSSSFTTLIDQCIEASGAIRKVDFSTFIASFKEMQGMVGKINSGEQGRTGFSQEDYEKLIKNNPDLASQFVQENDGTYTFLGSSMTVLTTAIQELTEVERQNQKSILVDKINSAGMMEALNTSSFSKSGHSMDITSSNIWTEDEMREYVSAVIQSANLNNIDLSSLGIAGLSSNTTNEDLSNMSSGQIEDIVSNLVSVYTSKKTNEDNYDKLNTEAAYSSARNYSMEHNIGSVNSLQSQAGTEGADNDVLLNNLKVRMSAIMSQAIEAGASEASLSEYRTLMDTVAGLDPTDENFAETLANLDFATPTQGLVDSIALLEEAEETTESWVSEYGYLDQLNREISRETLKRNRLESEYDRLLKSEGVTQEQLLQNVTKRLGALNKELNLNIQKGAEAEEALSRMTDQSGENADFAQFVNYDAETGSIKIDYEAAQTEFGESTELGEKFDEYVGTLYDLQDTADESRENIEDINSEVEEIKRTGSDEYNDLAHQISDALTANFQNQIDALSEVNDSISELNDSIVSSIQDAVDQQRQDRENEKAEQNITDKEARLAYLKMDTSGANALEIVSLEKEIADSKESYGDSLIDQSLQSLEDANAKAAGQRQQQIDLAQKQLKAYVSSGQAIADAEKLVQAATVEGADSLNDGLEALGLSMSADYTTLGTSITGLGTNFITQSMIESATLATSLGQTGAIATSLSSTGAIASSLGESGVLATSLSASGVLAGLIGSDGSTGLSGGLSSLLSTTADLHNMTEDEKATWQDNIDTAVNGAAVFLGIQDALGGEDGKAPGSVQDALATEFDNLDLKLDNIMGAEGTTMSGIRDNIINDILGGAEGKNLTDIESSLSGLLTDTEEQSLLEGIASAAGSPTPDYAGVYQALKDKNNGKSPLFQDYSTDIGNIEDNIATEAAAKAQKEKDQQTFDQIRTWNDLVSDEVEISKQDFLNLQSAGKIDSTKSYEDLRKARADLSSSRAETQSDMVSSFATSVGQAFQSQKDKEESETPKANIWGDVDGSNHFWTPAGKDASKEGWNNAWVTIDGKKYEFIHGYGPTGRAGAEAEAALNEAEPGAGGSRLGEYKGNPYIKWGGHWRTITKNASQDVYNKGAQGIKDVLNKLYYGTTTPKFKTGGLADFTGPAWLDGTKSHPELVLNARDTENFIQLKDILAHVMNSTNVSDSSVSNGDNYYEIEINVESLENDYDVEQLADKIRSMIYQDATHRNVNVLSQKA